MINFIALFLYPYRQIFMSCNLKLNLIQYE